MAQIDLVNAATQITRSFGVKINGVDRTRHFAGNWSCTHDAEQSFATGSLTVLQPFQLDDGQNIVELYAGWNGRSDLVLRGEIAALGSALFQRRDNITLAGFLRRTEAGLDVAKAFYYAGGSSEDQQLLLDQIGSDYQAVPIMNDAEIIVHILESYGITPGSGLNINHSIEASPWGGEDGSPSPAMLAPIFWDRGTPGWRIIQELDRCTTYRTFDGRTGAIYRRPILGTVPVGAKHTFIQAVDILSLELTRDFNVYNQVIVRGAQIESTGEQVEGISPIGGPQPSPYIPNPPGTRTDESINSQYIETIPDAEQLADVRLGILKQPLQDFDLMTFGCADFDVGDALGVESDILSAPAFAVAHTLRGAPFRSQFRLRGSTAAEERPNQPPTPAFTVETIRERMVINGILQDVTLIKVDASASSDSDGVIVEWQITIDGTSYSEPRVTHPHVGPPPALVSVTVTDDRGAAATLEQSVTWSDSTVLVEPIAVAEATAGELSDDGESTWREFIASAEQVAPIAMGGSVCYGCADGKLYRTRDGLRTAPELVHTFSAAITALWNNETSTDRWYAGLANGELWVSADDATTWTLHSQFSDPINDLAASPANANEITISAGTATWRTFGGPLEPIIASGGATALRHAAGFDALYSGFSDGTVQRRANVDGATQTITLPTPAQIRGLTLAVDHEELYIFTDSSATYRWSPDAGLQPGPSAGSPTNRAIRSFVGGFVYLATDDDLKKWFPLGSAYQLRDMTGSRTCRAVGYSSAGRRPTTPVAIELVALPWAATGEQDRIWHYQNGLWTGKLPPIAGRRWQGVAASASNPNDWLIWGFTSKTNTPTYGIEIGQLVSLDDHQPAIWRTTNAGASWSPVHIPVATVNSRTGIGGNLFASYSTTSNDILVAASVLGSGTDQFQRSLTAIRIWRNGVQIWQAEPKLASMPISWLEAGQDDDIILAGAFAGFGSPTHARLGYVPTGSNDWQQVGPDYEDGDVTTKDGFYATFDIEPGSRRLVAISTSALGEQQTVRFSTDYRADALSAAIPAGANGLSAGWSSTGAFIGQKERGIQLFNPTSQALTAAYGSPADANSLRVARQLTRKLAAARLGSTTTTVRFGVNDGTSWTDLAGPPGVNGSKLSIRHEVIER